MTFYTIHTFILIVCGILVAFSCLSVYLFPLNFEKDSAYYDDSDAYYGEQTLADMVTEFLTFLSNSPGSFESDVEYMTSNLNSWVTTEELLKELVELIYTQVRKYTFSLCIISLLNPYKKNSFCEVPH